MMLEHVNLTVSDLEKSIAFYGELFDFEIRWRGETSDGQPAAHVGGAQSYLALFEAETPGAIEQDYGRVGINHFGLCVENLDELRRRLQRMEISPHQEADYEPGVRLYFFDPDGIEVELVEYKTPAHQ